jgi:hypothetical protein
LQSDPQKDLNQSNWVLGSSGKRAKIRWPNSGDGGRRRRGEPARKDQGARGNLIGGAVQVGGGGTATTRGGGDRAQLRWRCSDVVAHQRWTGGRGKAPGGQGGPPKLLVGS